MTDNFEGDRLYGVAGQFDTSPPVNAQRVPAFEGIVLAFLGNLDRIVAMHRMALELIFWVNHSTRMACAAFAELGKPAQLAHKGHDDEIRAKIAEVSKNYRADPPDDYLKSLDQRISLSAQHLRTLTRRNLELGEAAPDSRYVVDGIDAIFAAMVTGSYAAFETLAADLWIAALNLDSRLARNWIDKNRDKNISFKELAGLDFDLSKQMGTYLSLSRKVGFQSLKDIKNAYLLAFEGGAETCFDPYDDLKLASSLRNVLSHRGGLIDSKFLEEVEGHTKFSSQQVGKHLLLDGEDVKKHMDTCVQSSARLIQTVQDWVLNTDQLPKAAGSA